MHWLLNIFRDRNFGATRNSAWPKIRDAHIKKHPKCAFCGKIGVLMSNHVHHIFPIWKFPELELAFTNLMTLCPRHHFELGHFFDWKSWNKDLDSWVLAIKNRP